MDTPDPIRRFVEATNAGDTEAFLDSFTPDAFLSDWGRSFRGREQIARWNQSDNIGVQSRFSILGIAAADGTCPFASPSKATVSTARAIWSSRWTASVYRAW
ncbi:nuclear transport factor 2 family protein [Mesorhizobium sp. M1340]|uniref:nuclear transport factor 2 family protein n=1 Tax=unclassified Mesorhizobium TaxID=325217 RepID=UPI0033357919